MTTDQEKALDDLLAVATNRLGRAISGEYSQTAEATAALGSVVRDLAIAKAALGAIIRVRLL